MFPFFLLTCLTTALHPQAAGRLANGADSSLFYWLTPARNGNASAPLLVWLNGGPGSSSMMGLFMELGPYTLLADGSGLGPPRAASWNAEFNVVFVDQPAGTGFSVATSDAGYVNNQSEVGTSFVSFLLAFYEAHPELTANELWLTGESYAGKYIPAIANAILAGGDATSGINFQGVAIGNGLTRPREMTLSVAASFFAVGVIDGAQRDAAQALALAAVAHIDAANWTAATAARSTLFDYLEQCNGKDSFPNVDNFEVYGEYNESAMARFLNTASTKAALHLPSDAVWSQHSDEVHAHLAEDIMKDYSHLIPPLLDAGLRVLLYTGQLDLRDGIAALAGWLPEMKGWSALPKWFAAPRTTWISPIGAVAPNDRKQPRVAGYYRSCANLTHMTVGGAGHLVPMDQPDAAQDMIVRFVKGQLPVQC